MRKASSQIRIALLMDEDAVASMVQSALIGRGHRVDVASCPADVTDALRAHDVDVVLIETYWLAQLGDAGIVDMRKAAGRRVGFVFVGAYAMQTMNIKLRTGIDTVMPAPFSLRQLFAAIEAQRSRRRYQPDIQSMGLPA